MERLVAIQLAQYIERLSRLRLFAIGKHTLYLGRWAINMRGAWNVRMIKANSNNPC